MKPVIYQLLPRLFTNQCSSCVHYGTIEQNGVGKMNDITGRVLDSIRALGVTHVWYTGVIEHATTTDYSQYGITRDNPHIVKGKAGSPYAIKDYYDGYRFSIRNDVTMYNPVSIGKFFNGGCSFDNFWIETGAQSLVNEIVERHYEIFRASDEFSVPISKTTKFEVRRIFTEHPDTGYVLSYLLQAGYLTIRREEAGDYVLSYPNLEVKDAMDAAVLTSYGLDFESERVAALRSAFREGATEKIIKVLYNSFTTYPYHLTLDREKGFQIVAATEKAESLIYNVDMTKPTAFVMGSEGKGISSSVLALCDVQARIPMRGDIGSLNVSVAASVMLFEAVRQRQQ